MADDLPRLNSMPPELAELEAQLVYRGQWAPLFVEPMVGSGERLTFAIVVRDERGAAFVERVIRPEVLRMLYGHKARYFSEMLAVAEAAAAQAVPGETCEFPVDGFVLGAFRAATGRSKQDLFDQGRMMCASLANATVEEQHAGEAEEDERETGKWAQRVQAHVTVTAHDLGQYFHREWAPSGNPIPTKLGFFNGRYAVQFGVVRRDHPTGSLYHLNARLWQLVAMQSDAFTVLRQRDLILARPRLDSATTSLATRAKVRDVVDRVIQDASQHGIHVMHTDRVEDASRRVFQEARAA